MMMILLSTQLKILSVGSCVKTIRMQLMSYGVFGMPLGPMMPLKTTFVGYCCILIGTL